MGLEIPNFVEGWFFMHFSRCKLLVCRVSEQKLVILLFFFSVFEGNLKFHKCLRRLL